MDVVLLKTFLEVARVRHFGRAAEALCVTQSAVSARIKLLESTLGVELFVRKRNDIQLTPAGHRLVRHAETMVRNWSRARQDLALGNDFARSLAVGLQADLWRVCVRDWALALRANRPDLALTLEVLPPDRLEQRLWAGQLDLGFFFDPPRAPELAMEQVARVPLVMVCTRAGTDVHDAVARDYLLVDWGPSFLTSHARLFPGLPGPALRLSQGELALDLLRHTAGAAYLPRQMAEEALAAGALHPVAGAPQIERQAYVVYRPDQADLDLVAEALCLARKGA